MKPCINYLIYHTDNDSFGLSPPLPPHTDFSLWAVTAWGYLLTQTSFFELSLPLPPHTDFSLWAVISSISSHRLLSLSCHLLTQTSLFELSSPLPPHIDFSLWSVGEGLAQNLFLHPRASLRPKRTEHFLRSLLIYSLYLKSYSDEAAASKPNPWDSLNVYIN